MAEKTQAEDDTITRKIASQAIRQALLQPTVRKIQITVTHADGSGAEYEGSISGSSSSGYTIIKEIS